jgi:hypothetical protein
MLFPAAETFSQEECTVGIVAGLATVDGRPLLWKNRDSDQRNNAIAFFKGPRYDFIGIINAGDTTQVWMGLNTAGFAIINSESLDQPGDSVDTEGYFMKLALGACGRLSDFENLMDNTNTVGRGTKSNFGCIDAFGGSAFYETGNKSYTCFNANNASEAPLGFLVRANFSMTGAGQKAYGAGRYHRAAQLFEKAVQNHALDHRYILRVVARDLVSDELNPYPLPYLNSFEGAPRGYVKTANSINRHRTVSCAVFHGVKEGENPALATMWCIPGEPICGIAAPLWPRSGKVTSDRSTTGESRLNRLVQDLEKEIYTESKWPNFANSEALVSGRRPLLPHLLKQEEEILSQVEKKIAGWRFKAPTSKELSRLQDEMMARVGKALR